MLHEADQTLDATELAQHTLSFYAAPAQKDRFDTGWATTEQALALGPNTALPLLQKALPQAPDSERPRLSSLLEKIWAQK